MNILSDKNIRSKNKYFSQMHKYCKLIIDTRESHVTRHKKELEGINYIIKQITHGDYAILSPTGRLMVTIERKSLDDFAASLKDGRHSNKEKLFSLRETTGCRIIYIIEGPEFPPPDKLFGRIPYKHIESSIFHLMINDQIGIIRSKDSLDTAKMLVRFVNSMNTLSKKIDITIDNTDNPMFSYNNYEKLDSFKEELSGFNKEENSNLTEQPIINDEHEAIALLTSKQELTDHEATKALWACFPGVSIECASDFTNKWSVADIVCDRVSRRDINEFKHSNGRKISKKAAESLSCVSKLVEIKLLSTINGMSKQSATYLLKNVTLKQLLSYNLEMSMEITSPSECVVGTNNTNNTNNINTKQKKAKRIGDVLAARIVRLFNYKYEKPEAEIVNIVNNVNNVQITDDDIEMLLNI